jgi:tetratricopeptide (TPR) repeat protein
LQKTAPAEQPRFKKTIAGLLAYRAGFLNEMAMFKQSIADCQEAIALVENLPAPDVTGAALYRWGRAQLWQQQHPEAIALFNKVIALADSIPGAENNHILLRLKADSLRSIGISYYTQELYEKAVEYSEAALAINRREGDRLSECCVLGNLGESNLESGNYPQAQRYCEEAQQILQDIPFVLVKSQVITTLGRINLHLGNYMAARHGFEQALELYRYMGSERFRAQGNYLLGLVYLLQGDYRTAQTYAQQALTIATEIGNQNWEINARLILGQALTELEKPEEAAPFFQQVLELYDKNGEVAKKTEPLAGLARLALRNGDLNQARRYLEELLSLAIQPQALFTSKFQPFLVYSICYEVLDAAKDPRRKQIQALLRSAVEENLRFIIEPETRQQILNQNYLNSKKQRPKSFALNSPKLAETN